MPRPGGDPATVPGACRHNREHQVPVGAPATASGDRGVPVPRSSTSPPPPRVLKRAWPRSVEPWTRPAAASVSSSSSATAFPNRSSTPCGARHGSSSTCRWRSSASSPAPSEDYAYGYSPIQGEMLARSLGDTTPPDLKETLNMGPLDLPEVIPPGGGAILAEPRWPARAGVAAPGLGGVLPDHGRPCGQAAVNHGGGAGAAGGPLRGVAGPPLQRHAGDQLPGTGEPPAIGTAARRRAHRLRHTLHPAATRKRPAVWR